MPLAARAFVDEPITDVLAAEQVARSAANYWGLEQPELLRSGMNAIFVAGGEVIRVSTPNADATASLRLATMLLTAGLRVTRPARDDVFVAAGFSATCWERIRQSGQPIDWHEVGAMVSRAHQIKPSELPHDYPLPSPVSFPWWDFNALLEETSSALDEEARSGITAAVDRYSRWIDFDDVVVCHGDVHPGNVIMADDGPVLIDWDLLCAAPPGWDHAPMMTWQERWGGHRGEYSSLAAGYGRSLRGDGPTEAFAELRLVAATLMRVKTAMVDRAAAPEAERRLCYWRGEPNAPTWRAQ